MSFIYVYFGSVFMVILVKILRLSLPMARLSVGVVLSTGVAGVMLGVICCVWRYKITSGVLWRVTLSGVLWFLQGNERTFQSCFMDL